MLSQIKSAALIGLDSFEVIIEIDISFGLPNEILIGLPDTIIKESKNRIKTAIKNAGFDYPARVYTINLAPADLPKEGPRFDLPIAIGILQATQQLQRLPHAICAGELSLDGSVQKVKGIISICNFAKKKGIKTVIIPNQNIAEASMIQNLEIIGIDHLSDLKSTLTPSKSPPALKPIYNTELNFKEVKGHTTAKRALQIAATGKHNILLIGPPGSGKSMLLKRLPSIMLPLTIDQALECLNIRSISKSHQTIAFTQQSPFVAPHHTTSYAGMIGGGKNPQPGEISLAHNGILFLDEIPEFQRNVLESLRQPIEDKKIAISRVNYSVTFPSNFLLATTMNPCPCGYYKDLKHPCKCSPISIKNYWKKLSGPILDRIDIILEIPRLKKEDLLNSHSQSSEELFSPIKLAQTFIQQNRPSQQCSNGNITDKNCEKFCKLSKETQQFLGNAIENGHITGRSYQRLIKVARSIADLQKEPNILHQHILEAVQYRKALNKYEITN